MGVVHLARKPGGQRVALKVLRPHIVGDDEARARLARVSVRRTDLTAVPPQLADGRDDRRGAAGEHFDDVAARHALAPLVDIQFGRADDTFGWLHKVC